MRRYTVLLLVLFLISALALIGCGKSGDDGSSPWERAFTQQGEDDSVDYDDQGGLSEDFYSLLSGVYANPGNSYELLLLYADGTYVLGNPMYFDYGDYTADESSMTVDLKGQGTWDIASSFAYVVDDTGDPWAKILEDILKDDGDDGEMTRSEAEEELVKANADVDEIFTEEELEEMDRKAMEELGDGPEPEKKSRKYTPADVAATYGTSSAGDTQLTLNADGTYEEGHGLRYVCGLFHIVDSTIVFELDPTQDLTGWPECGDTISIGENGQTLIDDKGNVWRREPRIEHDPYDPGI
jgi:hypothetical protein